MTHRRTLGVVVNPIAGMGGRVGTHGTDGAALAAAVARGAEPVAAARAQRAVRRLNELVGELTVRAVAGPMGINQLPTITEWIIAEIAVGKFAGRSTPLDNGTCSRTTWGDTTAADTRAAIAEMVSSGVDLILFVGGDGTARDVAAEAGTVPVLGVPSGVKMHSGVFATSPEAAGEAVARYLVDPSSVGTRDAEIVDLDADGVTLYRVARVPNLRAGVQRAKAIVSSFDDASLAALGREVATQMRPRVLYLLGPGTTVAQVSHSLGVPACPLGFDAVIDGKLLAADAGEAELLALIAKHSESRLVLGVIGGQGFLLGRGNQQLSPAVLRAIGVDGVDVLAAPSKIAALDSPVLYIDIDDLDLADALSGFCRVRTAPRRSTVLRISPASGHLPTDASSVTNTNTDTVTSARASAAAALR